MASVNVEMGVFYFKICFYSPVYSKFKTFSIIKNTKSIKKVSTRN